MNPCSGIAYRADSFLYIWLSYLYIKLIVTAFALSNTVVRWLLFHKNRFVIELTSSGFPVKGFVPLI